MNEETLKMNEEICAGRRASASEFPGRSGLNADGRVSTRRRSPTLVQLMFAELVVDAPGRDAEQARRLRLIAVGVLKG